MIDTHSHLFDIAFVHDLDQCINRCIEAKVHKIILVGFSKETNELAQKLAQRYSIFYPTAGLHPSEADQNYEKELKALEKYIKTHKIYAIGECGLDYHYGKENEVEQKILFEGQVLLAIKYNLPLIVHMRDATLDTYTILKKYKGKVKGVMHCYSGSLEMALEFMGLGFYISLGGPVTFKNAKESKRIAQLMDIKRLLIETDCPYLAPVPYRGQRNESSYVVKVAEEIAKLRNIELEEVERITEQNAIQLFGMETNY